MEQPNDSAAKTNLYQTRTLVLRLMCDEQGAWYAALSEPSSADDWRITCDGLDAVWQAMLRRLGSSAIQDTHEEV